MKYHLNPTAAFVLYSVGEDANDDGGDAALRTAERIYGSLERIDLSGCRSFRRRNRGLFDESAKK